MDFLAYELDRLDRDRRMVCLYELGVANAHRSRGARSALVEELKAYCRREKMMKAWVVANRSNRAAIRLYERAGGRIGAGADDVVFVWESPAWILGPFVGLIVRRLRPANGASRKTRSGRG